MRFLPGRRRLKLGQSLGAFRSPDNEDISPLYVFFEVANEGREPIELSRLYVTPKGERSPMAEVEMEGERPLPLSLAPGETTRFWVRAKTLARELKEAGHGGRPRLVLVAEDGGGGRA
ncbi:MAG: hypothetical protein AB1425_06885 [Actinomycetota bacterium]